MDADLVGEQRPGRPRHERHDADERHVAEVVAAKLPGARSVDLADPATNALTRSPDTPTSMAAGNTGQIFVISFRKLGRAIPRTIPMSFS